MPLAPKEQDDVLVRPKDVLAADERFHLSFLAVGTSSLKGDAFNNLAPAVTERYGYLGAGRHGFADPSGGTSSLTDDRIFNPTQDVAEQLTMTASLA